MTEDLAAAHRAFSADFFNRTWELLEKKDRSKEDDERMVSLAHASLAHWQFRDDCKPRNYSIGYWQISRVYAVLGQAERARHYGELCLAASKSEPPFFLGYAHEALARAAKLAADEAALRHHLAEARLQCGQVADSEEHGMLQDDLEKLSRQIWKADS